ncbi:tensin-1 isoform X4 [Diorhabda carinulata]|uniref:tensin-1 isoform X4 n=1 Tax=Diorhabda carinulata TaxID=1163345 RepID=UPI0025A09269|nr:tensin-1 isoform X4 [Diorhabda carinulata]
MGHNKRSVKNRIKELAKDEIKIIRKEAALRYTDTSWHIFNQSRKVSPQKSNTYEKSENLDDATPLLPTDSNEPSSIIKENQQNSLEKSKEIIKDVNSSCSSLVYDQIRTEHDVEGRTTTVEVAYEQVKNQADIVLHAHEESMKTGHEVNKMLRSTSCNGFGEALTSQPRSTRGGASTMDLGYVTERIISMWFPSSATSRSYRQGQQQVAHMLKNKHGDNYMVFNLSEPKRSLRNEHKNVKEVGWAPNLAPPLEKLCSMCKEIDSWLSGDKHRIAVLHSRGNKDKLGVIVSAYMHYSSICGNAEQALDRFSMRKFLDDTVGPLILPSNKRYVDYFSGLLSHNIKINAAPMYLTHVTVLGAPSFCRGGCKAFLKLYEGHTPIYTSGVYFISNGVSQFTVNVSGEGRRGLQLRGDILIKCYHRSDTGREIIFACQFHTCAVSDHTLSFTRQELDGACNDPRFPLDGAVELHFSPGPEGRHPVPAPTPAVPFTLADDPVTRADSPLLIEDYDDSEEYDEDDVNHTFGPLDGSIYATIAKKTELSPGAVSSPLTVSMDSGISSAGHHPQNANTTASSGSPPPTAQTSPLTPEDQHRELDELLSDMMLTVQSIPDLKTSPSLTNNGREDEFRFIDDEDEKSIPYHARQSSQPFSYGINANMISESKRLASPSLVRKVSGKGNENIYKSSPGSEITYKSSPGSDSIYKSSMSNDGTLRKVQAQVYPEFGTKINNYPKSDNIFHTNSTLQPIKSDFREEYYREDVRRYDPLKRSLTEGTIRRSPEKIYKHSQSVVTSPYSDTESLSPPGAFRNNTKSPEFHETYTNGTNLTWLQRQQQKLKERREIILKEERQPHETRLLSELRSVQSRHMRPTASHRLDGYTSDTTAFADDDEDYTIPLHINTMSKNGSTTPGSTSNYSTLKSTYSTTLKNERPFVSVKKAHERYTQNGTQTPAQILAVNPLGEIIRPSSRNADQLDNGLLSLAEKQQYKNYNQQQQHTVGIEIATNNSPSTENRLSIPRDGGRSSTADHRGLFVGQSSDDRVGGVPSLDGDRLEALNDLIANLSSGSDKSNDSPNNIASAWQYQREESIQSWRSQIGTEPDSSPSHNSSPRPQTPAFPVHARTPYTNASTPTVQFDIPSERLPPKSPTTQRRLSYPSSTFKNNVKWSLSPERKDRPTSPSDITNTEYSHTITNRSISATPTSGFREDYQHSPKSPTYNGSSSPTVYYGTTSRRSSTTSNNESTHEVSAANVKFVRDTSKFWYKPSITREQAILMLRDQQPGTFLVRDSNSFPGAFGLALKVATIPSNVQNKSVSSDDLIRHFLIEPTTRGVRLKGCQNEPVFSSLSALIYQHSITQMALPCRLVLPQDDLRYSDQNGVQQQSLFTQGAACNVLYLSTIEMESLTGPQAIKKAVMQLFQKNPLPETAVVHFKVSDQGVTLTDNKRKLFFRKHYPVNMVSYCGLDPDEHRWLVNSEDTGAAKSSNRIFGFVARKQNVNNPDNQCHLFAELEPEQPATAIVNFLNKVLTSSGIKPNII